MYGTPTGKIEQPKHYIVFTHACSASARHAAGDRFKRDSFQRFAWTCSATCCVFPLSRKSWYSMIYFISVLLTVFNTVRHKPAQKCKLAWYFQAAR